MRGASSVLLATTLLLHMTLASMFLDASPAYALTLEQAEAAAGRISAGEHHSLAVTPGGSVSAWGSNDGDQADVPSGLADVVAVSAGFLHSLALMSDGTAVGWGGGTFNWLFVPPGLDDAVAISAGGEHSLILRSDGTVVATGSNSWQQCDVPPGEDGFSAVSAGDYHSLALKSDGTVSAWGRNLENQCNVPSGNDFVAVAGGGLHSLALRSNGTVVAWGRNAEGQSSVPSGLSNVVAIAAGMRHSLALRSDGTVVAWGGATEYGVDGSVSVPSGLTDVVAIDAGGYHSLALLSGGTVVGWGDNVSGQCFGAVSVQPAPYSRDVPPDAVFSVSFSTNALAGPEYIRIALRDSGGSAVAITKALSGDVLTVTPTAPLNTDTSYTLVIPAGSLQDAYGSANPTYSFDYSTPDTIFGGPVPLPPVISVEGGNRWETAAAASELAYPEGADTVVIATGLNWPDALGGTALAGALDAPVLLVGNTVPAATAAEISRLKATHAVIVGGEAAVSDAVRVALEDLGLGTERVYGSNRYKTAEAIAARVIAELGEGYEGTAFIATGANFPDAIAAAPLAAANGWPLILAHPRNGLTPESKALLTANVETALILGGTAAVPQGVPTWLDGEGIATARLWGTNRYLTAIAIATYAVDEAGHTWDRIGIATGQNFPDALAGGVLQGTVGSVMTLTPRTTLHPDLATLIEDKAGVIGTVTYFGGTIAVSQAVRDAVSQILQ